MKILITESRLEGLIIDYLDEVLSPDYEWGPELDYYIENVKHYGGCDFDVNDRWAFSYYDDEDYDKGLVIAGRLVKQLNSLFGHIWEPVFIKWFEYNSGLKVKNIEKL